MTKEKMPPQFMEFHVSIATVLTAVIGTSGVLIKDNPGLIIPLAILSVFCGIGVIAVGRAAQVEVLAMKNRIQQLEHELHEAKKGGGASNQN